MYDFQTKSDAFLDINPLTKIVAFLVANILILGVKTYKVEIVFCILILFCRLSSKTATCAILSGQRESYYPAGH